MDNPVIPSYCEMVLELESRQFHWKVNVVSARGAELF